MTVIKNMSTTESIKNILYYPLDSDGFAVSFTDQKDWIDIMKKYNVLVVPILNDDECDVLSKDMWDTMGPQVTKDPSTWEDMNWPSPDHPSLNNNYIYTEKAFATRTHPKLVEVFETLYGTCDLLTTIDFYGIKRATIFESGERKDWRNKPLRLHWDCDVTKYVIEKTKENKRYQALIAVNENCQNVGSFACVPGSANKLPRWLEQYTPESIKYVPQNNPWQKHIQRLPLRKGHVVVWDFGTAHSNFSNYSTEPRLTMYCRMIPRQPWAIDQERQTITKYWKENPGIKKEVQSMKQWTQREKAIMGLN